MAQSLSDIRTAKWLRGEDVSTDDNWSDEEPEPTPEEMAELSEALEQWEQREQNNEM